MFYMGPRGDTAWEPESYTVHVANPLQKGRKLLCNIWPLGQGLLPGAAKQSHFQELGME